MLKNSLNLARKYGAKVGAAATTLALAPMAMAQQAQAPIDTILDAVSLDGISAKLVALATIVVGIALVFKGPDLAKRIIRKV